MASLANPFLAKGVEYAMNGKNTKKFLRAYERSFSQHFTTAETFCRYLHKELPHRFMRMIEEWEEYNSGDWAGLEGKHKLQTCNDLKDYYRRFKCHSEPLVKKEILSWQTGSSLFLEGLPKDIVEEYHTMRGFLRKLIPSAEQ
ncbi:BQ5605_C006g03958 [Microbotryum silenes-dioicae]|uniref:BQ5605_C006g03958 protein n=1 Tax=Microbotryum silenes-dioicae TaxID=796604 RepID=A0A2X0MSQ2_9BASI|nr:BQ5605_C006g03958 [Microbotryum silenes-dioicae]